MNLNKEKFLQDDILKLPDSFMLSAKHEIRQTVICEERGSKAFSAVEEKWENGF